MRNNNRIIPQLSDFFVLFHICGQGEVLFLFIIVWKRTPVGRVPLIGRLPSLTFHFANKSNTLLSLSHALPFPPISSLGLHFLRSRIPGSHAACMPIYLHYYKIQTAAGCRLYGLLSKKWEWTGWVMGDVPQTVLTARAPEVLKRKNGRRQRQRFWETQQQRQRQTQ